HVPHWQFEESPSCANPEPVVGYWTRRAYAGRSPRISRVRREVLKQMKEREKRRAVVLIPGVVNAFDMISGQRIAEAVNELGFKVDVCTLASCPVSEYDWCMLAAPPEAVLSVGDARGGLVKMRALRCRCKVVATTFPDMGKLLSLEKFLYDCEAIGVDAMLD